MRKLLLLSFVFCLFVFTKCSTESTPVYNLTTSVFPSEAGSVTPAEGEYDDGASVELTASANEGWAFQGWQGDHSGSQNPSSIVMNNDKEVTAQFIQRTYPLTINIEGEGNVLEEIIQEKSSDYESGTVVELTAESANGWRFVEWQGDISGTDNPTQITVDNPKDVTAVFERREYPLTVNIEGEGTVTEKIVQQRSTEYEFGTTVELTANPADGWEFVEWQGDISGSEKSTQITVDDAKDVKAVFSAKAYDLKIDVTGNGVIDEEIIDENGPLVELSATPEEGWDFIGWEGDLSGEDNPATILMDVPKEIRAIFEIQTFDLSVNIEGQGSVDKSPDRTSYDYGSTISLSASSESKWVFSKWTGDVNSSDNPLDLTIESDTEITAVFEEVDYDLTINRNGEGTVSQSVIQDEGPVIELTASASTGWEFVEWTGDVSGSQNPVELTVDTPKEVTAVFARKNYALTIETSGNGSVQRNPDQDEYAFEEQVELTAEPDQGHTFTGWSGDINSSENPVTIKMDEEKSVTAEFKPETFDLSVDVDGEGSVSKSPDRETYEFGSSVELSASSADGWVFSKWTGDVNSSDNLLDLTIEDDMELTAVFEEVDYDLTINRNGEGTVSQSVIEDEGPVVELKATASTGWEFVGWTGDVSGSQNPVQLTVDIPKEVTAVFERKSFPLTVNTDGEGSVNKSPDQAEYEFETEVELTASPSTGWEFVEWQGDLSGSNSTATITIDEAKDVTAKFEPKSYDLSVDVDGEGSVSKSLDQETYEYGTEVELSANPDTGWRFVEWGGDATGSGTTTTIEINEDKQVSAKFERKSYALTTHSSGNGSVERSPDRDEYEFESTVELTANPDNGYQFASWSGDISSSENPVTITMDEEKSLTANFEVETFELSVDTDGQGTVNIDPDESEYEFGETVTLTAEPDDEWNFVEWQGDKSSNDKEIQITMDSNKSVTAVFTLKTYELDVSTDGEGSVSKNPDQSEYESGSTVELTAEPESGWEFSRWQGALSGSNNPETITIDGNKSVTAEFVEKTYSVTTQVDGNGEVTVSPDQSDYTFGEEVTFEAIPDTDYRFVEWSGTFSSTNNPYTHEIDGDVNVTGEFEFDLNKLSYSFSDGVIEDGIVKRADLTLQNNTSKPVIMTDFELRDTDGDIFREFPDEDAELASNESITFKFIFEESDIQPTEEEFSNYETFWFVDYDNESYLVQSKVGKIDRAKRIDSSRNITRIVIIE